MGHQGLRHLGLSGGFLIASWLVVGSTRGESPTVFKNESDLAAEILSVELDEAGASHDASRLQNPATDEESTATSDVATSGPASREAKLPSRSDPAEFEAKMIGLRDEIRDTLEAYSHKQMNNWRHSPWEIMHGIIGYGVDTMIRVDGPNGKPMTAIGWLCYNRRGNGLNLFYRDQYGIAALNGPGMQGHSGQFLAMMAQSKVKIDYPIKVDNQDYTIADLVEYEKQTCQPRTELTFKLIGIVHYLGTEAEWKSRYGENWSIERLIKEELAQPIRGATCGGTHRLMGYSYSLRKRAKEGKPMVGQFARAKKFVEDYHKYTFKLQNPDGSFSTEWFRGRGNSSDLERKMQTSGHILEWIVYSLPEDELRDEQTVRAVKYLTGILHNQENRDWKVGPLGHAIHALVLYDQRVFGDEQSKSSDTPRVGAAKKDSPK